MAWKVSRTSWKRFWKDGPNFMPKLSESTFLLLPFGYHPADLRTWEYLGYTGLYSVDPILPEYCSALYTDLLIARDSTFKLPSRVTFNDKNRSLFLKELADSSVPLHRLAKSVPHGTKNAELLDVLFKNGVPSGRSGWYIGTLGAIEMVSGSCSATDSRFRYLLTQPTPATDCAQ